MPLIGLLSDAHGNISAFHSGIKCLQSLGVTEYFFLGDAIGYIACVDVLTELQNMGNIVKCIMGNHEFMVINGKINFDREPIYQHKNILSQLTEKDMSFIESFPTHMRKIIDGLNLLFVHGGPNNFTNEYVYPNSNFSKLYCNEDFVFMGHSHYPFIRKFKKTTFINVGSCGLPRDDGRYGACVTFDSEARKAVIYRYAIEKPLSVISGGLPKPMHPSVAQVFKRRAITLTGKIVSQGETT